MTPLACELCHEPVIPAPGTTRNGYSHEGGADHDVELADIDEVTPRTGDVIIRSRTEDQQEEARLQRASAAAAFGLPVRMIGDDPVDNA